MAGLDPAIHDFFCLRSKTWISPAQSGMREDTAQSGESIPSFFILRVVVIVREGGRCTMYSAASLIFAGGRRFPDARLRGHYA